ncbi:hypothetical protein DFH28DRAFT_962225, partial [Melampsora americana]
PILGYGFTLPSYRGLGVDPGTKEGIQVFLTHRSCTEKLCWISRKIQQIIVSALKTNAMFDHLQGLSVKGMYKTKIISITLNLIH